MRLFLWHITQLGMKTEEFDVKAAYPHSDLLEEIYMQPPYGMETYSDSGRVLVMKLNKSLYGLRQSGHNWMNDMFTFLREQKWTQSLSDTSIWDYKHDGITQMILFIHTDDGKFGYIHLRRELRAWGGVCKAKDYTRATRTNLPHHDRTKTAPSFNHTNKNKTPTSKRKRPSTKTDAAKRPRRS